MPARLPRFNRKRAKPDACSWRFSAPGISNKLLALFFLAFAVLIAQDPTSYLTPDVMRVGDRLACRCGGCRNTVGNCPMLHCHSADPMRHRIHDMQAHGMGDDEIVNTIVREQGVVALSSPPASGLGGIVTWTMPGMALLIGFFVYTAYVRRNRQEPKELTAADHEAIERFRTQIDRELEEPPGPAPNQRDSRR